MIRRRFLAALGGGAVALRGAEFAPSKIAEIEKMISMEMSRQQIPGMSIAIGKGTEAIWTNAYGMADLENFVPARAGTLFRTASIAKPITAVAVLQLHERGTLDLDAPVQKYVARFPEKQWPVTARQLLGHLGGIRAYRDDGSDFYNVRHFDNSLDALQVFEADPLLSEPGTTYKYSTYGYVLLGAIVESVAKMRVIEYFQANIFEPARMTATRADDHFTITPGRSRWYSRRQDGVVVNSGFMDTSVKIAGGGLVSTSADLVSFARAVNSGRLLKPETVKLMWTPLSTRDGKPTHYGLGWGVNELKGRKQVAHTGGQAGTSTLLRLLPDDGIALAMMFNLDGVKFNELADRILELV